MTPIFIRSYVKKLRVLRGDFKMEFAWNAQKNKMSDIKGKELEQERKGKISNEEINLDKTYKNYDLVKSNLNLYQRIKQRVEDVRENSRIQKNSVVSYSNVITVNKETFKKWGEEKSKKYLEEVYNYFCNEFGKENVVSAKVHLDETTPHMHLHFVPISSEGKLQARKVMTPGRINKVHSEAVKWLQERNFDITRGKGATGRKNIKDIHKYKSQKLKEDIEDLEKKKMVLLSYIEKILKENALKVPKEKVILDDISFKFKESLFSKDKLMIGRSDLDDIVNSYKDLVNENLNLKMQKLDLEMKNNELSFEIKLLKDKEEDLIKDRKYMLNKRDKLDMKEEKLIFRECLIDKREKAIVEELKQKDLEIEREKNKTLYYKDQIKYKDKYIDYLKDSSRADGFIIKHFSNKHGDDAIKCFKMDYKLEDMCLVVISSNIENVKENNVYKLNNAIDMIDSIAELNCKDKYSLRYEIYTDKSFRVRVHSGKTDFKNKDFKNHLLEEKNNLNEFLYKKIFIKSLKDSIEVKNIEKQIRNNRTFKSRYNELSL